MNERIQELFHESMKDRVYSLKQSEIEKFAELIVRECASLTLDFSKPSADYYHGWLDYRDEILKHFGVE